MEDRRSDTAETFGDQDPPGDVSNQNNEEPSTPEGDDGRTAGGRTDAPEEDSD